MVKIYYLSISSMRLLILLKCFIALEVVSRNLERRDSSDSLVICSACLGLFISRHITDEFHLETYFRTAAVYETVSSCPELELSIISLFRYSLCVFSSSWLIHLHKLVLLLLKGLLVMI